MSPSRTVVATATVCAASALTVAVLASPAQGPSGGPKDGEAVREVVKKYVAAREAKDPSALRALLTSDADQLVSDGHWRKGRDELVFGMIESSQRTGGHREITVESVRLVAPEVALADGRYKQTGLAGGQTRELWSTFVMVRGPQGWRIAAIRNMLPGAALPVAKP